MRGRCMEAKKLVFYKSLSLVLGGLVLGFIIALFVLNPFGNTETGSGTVGTSTNGSTQYEPVLVASRFSAETGVPIGDGALQLQNSFNQVVDAVLPAVVELRVTQKITQALPESFGMFPWFFGVPEQEVEPQEFETQSMGSGVIFRRERNTYYVITNNHVVGKADSIGVVLYDQSTEDATVVGTDERRDLAVVSFKSDMDLPVAALGDSDAMRVGDWVLAMGSPYGFISSVSAGIVSAVGRPGQQVNNLSDFIQTDAAINQGNSGGPLVNLRGEVIGINTWIAGSYGGNVGLGFSIPINNVKRIVDELIEFGSARDGWLGVSMRDLGDMPESYADVFHTDKGVFVMNVFTDSPAYEGGLKAGDVIVKFNATDVVSSEKLSRLISDADIKSKQTVQVNRFGKTVELQIKLDVRKPEADISQMNESLWPAVFPIALTDDIREELNVSKGQNGVAVYFMGNSEGSKLYNAGIRNMDIITKINDKKIDSIQDFYEAVNDESTSRLMFEFIRGGSEYYIGVRR
jgi:Do/DeqQ family serine protease